VRHQATRTLKRELTNLKSFFRFFGHLDLNPSHCEFCGACGRCSFVLEERAGWCQRYGVADTLGGIGHPVATTTSKVLAALIAGLVIADVGCSRSPTHGAGQSPAATARRVLSANEAAQLAAKLANDQCDRQYRKRPFSAAQHSAALQNGMYQWGGLDVAGPEGFSALVTFRPDGSEPHVEVYFSTDVLRPQKPATDLPPGMTPKLR
jgi:hypothetical protein